MRNHPQGISWMAWPLLVLGCFQVLSWHGLAHGFQIKPPWSLSSPTHGRRGSAPSMVEAVAYSDVTRAPPKVDAWALLVDAASGRKGPKNIKAPPPPEGFVNIVDYGPSGERGSRLRAGVLNAEMAQLSERLWGELRGELGYLKETDLADVRLALEISLYAHRGQVRRSGEPFIEHPVEVAKILGSLAMERDTVIAGLLHDTVEDTHLSLEEIEALFGEPVKTIVEGETKVSKLAKLGSSPVDYSEIQAENLRSLFVAMTNDYRVIFVKLADRLHNMKTLDSMPALKQVKISRETLDIYAPLADRLGMRKLKTELEETAFRYVYPSIFNDISGQLRQRAERYNRTLDGAMGVLQAMITRHRDLPLPKYFTVSGRLKSIYSLWRKMERKKLEEGRTNISIDDIQDVVALRVVIALDRRQNETESSWKERGTRFCYRLGDLIIQKFRAPGQEVKVEDYIHNPKPNGYQSLHLSIEREGQKMEVQVRTDWMDRVAEYGLAAHWLYKDERERRAPNSYYRIAWMNCVKEWQNEAISSKDFVEAVRREILGRRVSFFLKNGHIHDIPRGSKVIDAAFKIDRQLGMHLCLAERNGVLASLDEEVCNTDVIFIVAAKNARLSPRTATVAHCEATRSKIKRYFRSGAPHVAIADGERLVTAFLLANEDVLDRPLPSRQELEAMVRSTTGYGSLDDMYLHVALTMREDQIRSMLTKVLGLPPTLRPQLDITPLRRTLYKHRAQAVVQSDDYIFDTKSQPNQPFRLCPTCMPVAQDAMVSVPGRHAGEQVVHRADCRELRGASGHHVAPLSVDPSEWMGEDGDDPLFPCIIELVARHGTLYVLSTATYVLQTLGTVLLDACVVSEGDDAEESAAAAAGFQVMRFTVGVRDLSHLHAAAEALRTGDGVIRVRRLLLGSDGEGGKPPFEQLGGPPRSTQRPTAVPEEEDAAVPAMGL